jgi:hypothetical protein
VLNDLRTLTPIMAAQQALIIMREVGSGRDRTPSPPRRRGRQFDRRRDTLGPVTGRALPQAVTSTEPLARGPPSAPAQPGRLTFGGIRSGFLLSQSREAALPGARKLATLLQSRTASGPASRSNTNPGKDPTGTGQPTIAHS